MKFQFFGLVFLTGMATLARAHFVFVAAREGGRTAQVFLSEDLKPTAAVDVELIGKAKLIARDADGKEMRLTLQRERDAYVTEVPGNGTRMVYGMADLGTIEHGQDKPSLLIYHPKSILGDAFGRKQVVGGETPVEIVPLGRPGAVTLEALVHGQPEPGAEITVILPDGTQKKMKTNQSGQTETLFLSGRYGAWTRYWESAAGERNGKKYEQTRHYATLVFDAPLLPAATRFATLPQAASSFGEVVSDGWLYVYGGHIARTHAYSTAAVSGRFERLHLSDKKTWEELPNGPGLQGMNLAAYQGEIYRIGGMQPRNKPGEKQAVFSVADCARFDPATGQWEELPSLPDPRSSHDVVVAGGQLIVVGGWTLAGPEGEKWADTLAMLDLTAPKLAWKSVKQPFKRRALIAAADADKMYVIGGVDDRGGIVRDVAIYDLKAAVWTQGPALPGGEMNGFAPAACVHDGVLYLSVADGSLYRLGADGREWQKLGTSTPRLAHRMGFWAQSILISGGAAQGNNSDLIEEIPVVERRIQ